MSPDGSIIAASAYESSENGQFLGHVRVFKEALVNGMSTWKQMGSTLIRKGPFDRIGRAIDLSLDGLRLVAGATQLKGDRPGYVQVFEWDGDDWAQVGQDVYCENDQDVFGRDVALSDDGTIFAAGANLADNPEKSAGMAQVYQLQETDDGNQLWTQFGQTFLGELEDDGLGLTVALSDHGLRFVVAASQKNGGTGYVRIFDFDIEKDEWIQLGSDLRGENDLDKFGTEVVLSRDANTLAVGTIASDLNGEDSGHVQVFNLKALLE